MASECGESSRHISTHFYRNPLTRKAVYSLPFMRWIPLDEQKKSKLHRSQWNAAPGRVTTLVSLTDDGAWDKNRFPLLLYYLYCETKIRVINKFLYETPMAVGGLMDEAVYNPFDFVHSICQSIPGFRSSVCSSSFTRSCNSAT